MVVRRTLGVTYGSGIICNRWPTNRIFCAESTDLSPRVSGRFDDQDLAQSMDVDLAGAASNDQNLWMSLCEVV